MVKQLADLLPFPKVIIAEEFEKKQAKHDFGKCKICGKEYQIYHIDGVCFDCDIEDRMKNDKDFREAIEAAANSWGD